MNFKVGDIVSRKSHNNDIIFKIVGIKSNVVYLSGINLRLCADADMSDIVKEEKFDIDDDNIIERNQQILKLNRENYFYIPGNILHIDGDNSYLKRCMKLYKELGIKSNGIVLEEKEISSKISELLEKYRPDIIVITGHDSYVSKNNNKYDLGNYENTIHFISAIKAARKYEKSQDKLIIIAGACQSDYEELIKAGANFASSPKRINIHALDPAIIASSIALSDKNQSIDLIKTLEKTKYGSDGIGGIITNGTMYVGYPR